MFWSRFNTFFIYVHVTFIHFLFERHTACSFCWKTNRTDVNFVDGSVFKNRIRIEFRFSAPP